MGLYIKGAKKPTECRKCIFIEPSLKVDNEWRHRCFLTLKFIEDSECPLIEIPAPHGRLIDADELKAECYRTMDELMKSTTMNISAEALSLLCGFTMIGEASTILEAEE